MKREKKKIRTPKITIEGKCVQSPSSEVGRHRGGQEPCANVVRGHIDPNPGNHFEQVVRGHLSVESATKEGESKRCGANIRT